MSRAREDFLYFAVRSSILSGTRSTGGGGGGGTIDATFADPRLLFATRNSTDLKSSLALVKTFPGFNFLEISTGRIIDGPRRELSNEYAPRLRVSAKCQM